MKQKMLDDSDEPTPMAGQTDNTKQDSLESYLREKTSENKSHGIFI